MSVQQVDTQSEHRRRMAVPAGDRALDAAAARCSCTSTSLSSPAGEIIIVLRVAGEVDLSTVPVLQAALADSLARGPRHLVVDLAGLAYCSARGLTLLVDAGRTAGGQGTGYAVTGASGLVIRLWMLLWAAGELPIRYPTAAAGVIAALVRQTNQRPERRLAR